MGRAGLLCVVFVASLSKSLAQPSTPSAEQEFFRAATGVSVVKHWRPAQHLYVKGDIGVGSEQLNQLEVWLDQNATNWTVVLLEDAGQEEYRDAAGDGFTGIDAVEHALGKGLPSQTAFGQFTDSRTQERNGAFFLLFLKERKFSYYGSDAQDRRGLGEDHWAGTLDRPAIAAMRGGGRIVDAVKDTIVSINSRFEQQIAAEQRQQERRQAEANAERVRMLDLAKASLENATNGLHLLEQKIDGLRRDRPGLAGDLVRPDLAGMRAELKTAQAAIDDGDSAGVASRADRVKQRAFEHVKMIEEFQSARPELDALETAIEAWSKKDSHGAAMPILQSARQDLAQARLEHERANAAYAASLNSARQSLREAENRINDSLLDAARRRQFAVLGSLAALGILGGLGIGLNRRRFPDKREAHQLAALWSKGLEEKTRALFDLLDWVSGVLGASSQEAAQRYSGETLKISQQIIQDVDELMIMSACAGRVLSEARARIEPVTISARLLNGFSRRNYRAAIRRLRDEPVAFRPEDGLELVVRGPKTERDSLLGRLESYQPFAMSFNQLMETFNERAGRALSNLERVQSSIRTIGDALVALRNRIQVLKGQEKELLNAGGSDGWFCVGPVFSELLPGAAQDHTEAVVIGVRDAVGALEGAAALAKRKLDDAEALIGLSGEFHRTIKPRLQAADAQLREAALDTSWIGKALYDASQHADSVARQAISQSMAGEIKMLQNGMEQLADRVDLVVALDLRRRGTTWKSIEEASAVVDRTRQELAAVLHLGPDKILREPDRNPSDRLVLAREQLAGAKASLERGDPSAAQDGLGTVDHLVEEVNQIIVATRKACAAHETVLAECRQETARLASLLPAHEQILAQLQADYAPSVLGLGQGDPEHPSANSSIHDNLEEVRLLLEEIGQSTEQAVTVYPEGRVLESSDLLEEVRARQNLTAFRLQEIEEKRDRVKKVESANLEAIRDLENEAKDLESKVEDMRTMEPTLKRYTETRQRFDRAIRLVNACPKEPFVVADLLGAVARDLSEVADQARRDWEVFDEAQRSLESAANQLEAAHLLAQEASSDQAGDSVAIVEACRGLEQLDQDLCHARPRINRSHADWSALDAEADRIAHEAGRVAAILRGDLQAAQTALESITAASAAVRTAGLWTGPFGVTIAGCPGAELLAQARRCLQEGAYAPARQAAESAQHAARQAVAAAQAEVLRQQRAEEERQEQERRRREQQEWHRRHSIPSLGRSRSGFGHSTFSSGSGARRSSFSRGSGVGRSGW